MMNNLTTEVDVYKDQLKIWIEALGIPQYQPSNTEIEEILQFTRESLRDRSSIELSEDTVMLSHYSLFLQQKTNECKTFLKWASNTMNRLPGEDRSKLTIWIRQTELRVERISYLTRRIELIAQCINNLVRTRYNERKIL